MDGGRNVRDLSDKQGSEERRNEWPRLSDRDRDRIYLGYGHSLTPRGMHGWMMEGRSKQERAELLEGRKVGRSISL